MVNSWYGQVIISFFFGILEAVIILPNFVNNYNSSLDYNHFYCIAHIQQ